MSELAKPKKLCKNILMARKRYRGYDIQQISDTSFVVLGSHDCIMATFWRCKEAKKYIRYLKRENRRRTMKCIWREPVEEFIYTRK